MLANDQKHGECVETRILEAFQRRDSANEPQKQVSARTPIEP